MSFSKLVDYIEEHYLQEVQILQDQYQVDLQDQETQLQKQMTAKLEDYQQEQEIILKKEWQRKLSALIVSERIAQDRYRERVISEMIEETINDLDILLLNDEDFARKYYQRHLEYYQHLRPIDVIVIDKRFVDLPKLVWHDFQGYIRTWKSTTMEIHVGDMTIEIHPRSLYKMQKHEIRSFLLQEIFR